MNAQGLSMAMEFMQRVDLKGGEVPAFNLAMQSIGEALQEARQPPCEGGEGEEGAKV